MARATITNLQTRLDATTTSNTLMKEELALAKMALAKTQEENTLLKAYVRNESMHLTYGISSNSTVTYGCLVC